MSDPKAVVTREELALALAILREHNSVSLRLLLARAQGDDAGAMAQEERLAHLDEQLASRWGLQDGSGGLH
jgi:hypothetical protein